MKVQKMLDIVKEHRPKRFNVKNKGDSFNDPRITDFAYINLYKMFQLLTMFKSTGIIDVKVAINYKEKLYKLSTDNFEYCLNINEGR